MASTIFQSKANEAGSWIAQRLCEIKMIEVNFDVQSMNVENIKIYVENINKKIGEIYGNQWGTFAIGSIDGIGYVSQNNYIDISNRDYFIKGKNTDYPYLLSKPIESKTDNEKISLIHYPLIKDDEYFGFINAAITLDKLDEIIKQIDFYDSNSIIIDTEGNIYAGNENTFDKDIITTFKNNIKTNNDSLTHSFKSKDEQLFYTSIPNTNDWYLCSSVNRNNLMSDTIQLINNLVIISITLLSITILISFFLSKSIAKPILIFTKKISENNGDLNIIVDEKGNDEISILAKSFNKLIIRINLLLNQKISDEKDKRLYEIKTLQNQINPHFLYNTLDTLNWKAIENNDFEMIELIDSLSNFYRISLSNGDEFITLDKEIEHIKYYLKIQKVRFSDILDYNFIINCDLDKYYIVKLCLQPIIENAIIHGINPSNQPGNITIKITDDISSIKFSITDDGVGISDNDLIKLHESLNNSTDKAFGLYNINQRLRLIYGEQYRIQITSIINKYTTVTFEIPKVRKE